jgi:hypothetical protein
MKIPQSPECSWKITPLKFYKIEKVLLEVVFLFNFY